MSGAVFDMPAVDLSSIVIVIVIQGEAARIDQAGQAARFGRAAAKTDDDDFIIRS